MRHCYLCAVTCGNCYIKECWIWRLMMTTQNIHRMCYSSHTVCVCFPRVGKWFHVNCSVPILLLLHSSSACEWLRLGICSCFSGLPEVNSPVCRWVCRYAAGLGWTACLSVRDFLPHSRSLSRTTPLDGWDSQNSPGSTGKHRKTYSGKHIQTLLQMLDTYRETIPYQ